MKNILTLLLLLSSFCVASAQRNVILIIADDLGSDWCGFQEDHVDTVNMPNVRKLLSRGVRFSNAWANPVCSPTRAGILTGRYSFRTGVGNVVTNAASAQLSTSEITVANLLKTNAPTNYATANIGKWHLQSSAPANFNNPSIMGFEQFAGVFTGQVISSYSSWTKITNGVSSTSTTYSTVDMTNDAINWMGQQTTKPFFLWMAYNAPHSPFHLPPSDLITNQTLSGTTMDINQNPKKYFKVMAEAMDNQIGRIYTWLEANNKLDNTDIIFIGDNGDAPQTAQSTPTSRTKSTVYQAGVHVPMIISGPSVVNQGRVSNALVNTQDLFATMLELADYANWATQIPVNKPVDSKSLVPILSNTATDVRTWAFVEVFGTGTADDGKAMRNQNYKLINFDNGIQEFYNLTSDPNEATNLLSRTLTATETSNYTSLCTSMSTLLGVNVCTATNLPVELIFLKAQLVHKTTVLNWQTASENNNKSFIIERSTDGLNYAHVGEVKGKGTTNASQSYTFTDRGPSVNTNYYRLRQTDFNGKETISSVVSVFLGNASLTLKNTLVHQTLDIIALENLTTTINIYNVMGQLMYQQPIKDSQQIDVSRWQSGVYILHTSLGKSIKFVKD
jgi:arylsulfatase B